MTDPNKFAASLWMEEALKTAALRRKDHKTNGNKKHWGIPDDLFDEYFGSLGQIVFREHVKQAGLDAEFCPLYVPNTDLRALPPWDAKVEGKTFEIKTIPPNTVDNGKVINRKYLLVKKSENHNSDIYVAVKFFDHLEYCIVGFATLQEVLSAKTFEKYAPAYAILLENLHPLEL